MGHANRVLPWMGLIAILGGGPIPAGAEEKPAAVQGESAPAASEEASAAAGKKKDPGAAERAYSAGTKAFEGGKMADAVQSLSTALSSGGLPPQQMAKALYYRGVAYRKLGKAALAISDLTTAVWLKGGLSDADRAQAIENRQLAYMEAGLGDPPPIGAQPLDAPPTATAAKPADAAKGPVASASVQPSSFWDSLWPWDGLPGGSQSSAQTATETAGVSKPTAATVAQTSPVPQPQDGSVTPAPPPDPQAAAPSVADLMTASLSGGLPGPAPPPASGAPSAPSAVPAALSAQPSETAPAPAQATDPLAGVPTTVAGLFSNIFSSPAGPPGAAATVVTTGSTGTAAEGAAQWSMTTVVSPTEHAQPPAESLPWTGEKAAAAEKTAAVEKPAAAEKAAAVERTGAVEKTTAAATPGAKSVASQPAPSQIASRSQQTYSLQVASVRSRDEAERLVASLKKYQALHNGAVSPAIDETVVGNMGTFYRVRLGPYADAAEPGQLCKSLKPQGFDCLVLTQ